MTWTLTGLAVPAAAWVEHEHVVEVHPADTNLPKFLLIAAIAFIVILVVRKLSSRRNAARGGSPHGCPNCGGANPTFAQFCRRCGRRLM